MDVFSPSELSPCNSRVDLSADVICAVENLKELKETVRSSAIMSSPKALDTTSEIISCLKDLDSKRLKCHDDLEKLTIKNSVLRHELATFDEKLKMEIEMKVKAARDSNSEQIASLEAKVSSIADKLLESIHKQKLLDMHNQMMEVEYQKLSEEHECRVILLNEMIRDKASMQITLNETKSALENKQNKIQGIKRNISATEKEMEKLQADYTLEMKLLHQTIANVRKKYERKTVQTKEMIEHLQQVRDTVFKSQLDADDKAETILKLQESVGNYVDKETQLRQRLIQGANDLNHLREKCEEVRSTTDEMKEGFDDEEKRVKEEIALFRKETSAVLEEFNKMSFVYKGLKRDLKNVMTDSKLQAKSLEEVKKSIHESKKNLLHYAEEGAKLTKEYGLLITQLEEMKNYHESTVNHLQDQMCELQDEHAAEKRMRSMAKDECNKLSTSLDTYNTKKTEEVTKIQTKAQTTKKDCAERMDRISNLERLIEEIEMDFQAKEKSLTTARQKLSSVKFTLTSEVETLEESIADIKEELLSRNETLNSVEPQCAAMELDLEEKENSYESKKKTVIGLKNKKAEIENKLKMCKKDLDMIYAPQEKLKMDCLRCRAYTRKRLHTQGKQVEEMEKQVMVEAKKVSVVNGENKKIMESKKKLEVEVERFKIYLSSNQEAERHLDAKLQQCKYQLSEKMKLAKEMEEVSSDRDRSVLGGISKLRSESENRLEIIRGIHLKFEDEIKQFNTYLENSIILGK